MKNRTILISGFLIACLVICSATLGAVSILPLSSANYLKAFHTEVSIKAAAPVIPDLTKYTHSAIIEKIPALISGRVEIAPMEGAPPLRKFSFDKRLVEAQNIQDRIEPLAIHIYSGVYDLHSLMASLQDKDVIVEKDEGYIVRLPIALYPDAALIITDLQKPLLLSQDHGGFIVSAGTLFIINSEVSGWNEETKSLATLNEKNENFRPFITTWDGSELYISNSKIHNLGYSLSKSYGISISTNEVVQEEFEEEFGDLPAPTGWIINSFFDHMYFGFYSYEAKDFVILGNTYRDNVIYGIDPHDRSERLIIANNDVSGSKKKHGIIISREVNNSWIVNNKTHGNHGSGIMLDRNCEHTVVTNNVTEFNHGDGITLYESPNNYIFNNIVENNDGSGIRIRNSWNIGIDGGRVALNKSPAFQIYEDRLDNEQRRDFELDKVIPKASATINRVELETNPIILKTKGFREIVLKNMDFSKIPQQQPFLSGDSSLSVAAVTKRMLGQHNAILITPWIKKEPQAVRRKKNSTQISEECLENPDLDGC